MFSDGFVVKVRVEVVKANIVLSHRAKGLISKVKGTYMLTTINSDLLFL